MTTATEIAEKLASEQNLSKSQAKSVVDSVFRQIADAAKSGAETNIPGFGKFKVKETAEREGRNPGTGATIKIAASKKLAFTPAKAVKTRSTADQIPEDNCPRGLLDRERNRKAFPVLFSECTIVLT
ncbi:HU family DNA-binding protein [Ochrobactrum cytisi]|nr:HU family DNA-binding protein [Brucella cytisi]